MKNKKNQKTAIIGFKVVKFMGDVRNKISADIKDMIFEQVKQYFEDRKLKLEQK